MELMSGVVFAILSQMCAAWQSFVMMIGVAKLEGGEKLLDVATLLEGEQSNNRQRNADWQC